MGLRTFRRVVQNLGFLKADPGNDAQPAHHKTMATACGVGGSLSSDIFLAGTEVWLMKYSYQYFGSSGTTENMGHGECHPFWRSVPGPLVLDLSMLWYDCCHCIRATQDS